MSRPPSPTLGAQVHAKRRARNMSTYALAERAGVSQKSIGRIERGEPVPPAHLEAVCRFLGLAVPTEGADDSSQLFALQAFGQLLHDRRGSAGLSRLELAQKAGVSGAMIKFIETARHLPSRAICIRLVRVPELGLSWADVAPLGLGPPPDSVPAPTPGAVDESSPQREPIGSAAQLAQAPRLAAISERVQRAAETAQQGAQESPATLRRLGAALWRLAAGAGGALRQAVAPPSAPEGPIQTDHITLPIGVTLEQAERELIRCTFAACQHSRPLTAEKLGISRRSLYYKLRAHKIPLS